MSRESAPRALRHMRQRDEGHIIQIGSALSYRAISAPFYGGAPHAPIEAPPQAKSELSFLAASISVFTLFTDLSNMACSITSSLISITFSTPLAPMMVGTPA